MILSSLKELRLYIPAHALDEIEPLMGAIDNSEHDSLTAILGKSLYDRLCEYYGTVDVDSFEAAVRNQQLDTEYDHLLHLAQNIVAYDVMPTVAKLSVISINNAGINSPTSEDYGKVTDSDIQTFTQESVSGKHKGINRLLEQLEEWAKEVQSNPVDVDVEDYTVEEIVAKWRESRYYYLAASLLIPSALVLQRHIDIYESREKFIQLLPDLRYVQEQIITPAIGEEFCEYLADKSLHGTDDKVLARIITMLRTAMAFHLQSRTEVLKLSEKARTRAHDDAVLTLNRAMEYIPQQQDYLLTLTDTFKSSPLYKQTTATDTTRPERKFTNDDHRHAMFITPMLH